MTAVVIEGHCYSRASGLQRMVPVRHKLDDRSWAALAAAYKAVGGTKDRL